MTRPPIHITGVDLSHMGDTRVLTTDGNSSQQPPPPPIPPPEPPQLQTPLSACDRPLALFPVRLETRFFTLDNGAQELRVRVYPDKITLDSHEPTLLVSERDWGIHYWTADWQAGDDLAARKAAWRQLADRYGAPRAAFIARQLRPTNARSAGATPAFPSPPIEPATETSAWRSAPQARLLPKNWIAILSLGGRAVAAASGAPITLPLAVGPDPKSAPATGANDAPVDEGMRWMVDFAAAEAAGMGLRIPLPAGASSAVYDSLVVLGASDAAPDQAASNLAALIDAHHYTDGLELLAPGAVTNNTTQDRSAFAAVDPGQERSFAREVGSDPDSYGAAANTRRLGAALGLAAKDISPVLGRLDGGADTHDLDGQSINAALWPTTWGYLAEGLIGLGQAGLTDDLVQRARRHFISHVRGLGAFPPLRAGRQPYGLLPVTSLDLFQPAADDTLAPKLRDLMVKLRDQLWRPHLAAVPRLGARTPPDPDADLADIMRTEGISRALRTRSALGRHYLVHLRAFVNEDLANSGFLAAHDQIASAIPGRLGLSPATRVSQLAYADFSWPVKAPWIQAAPIGADVPLSPDFIGQLLGAKTIEGVVDLVPSDKPDAPPLSLLQTLARHALLREIAAAAARITATNPNVDLGVLLRETELIDLVEGAPPTQTWRRLLDVPVASVTGQQTLRAFIESQTAFTAPGLAALGELRAALDHLRSLDTGKLDLLLKSGIDLASHRLDAWVSSFASSRLETLRATAPEGLYVGAYGWVENLRPAPALTPVATLPAGETAPLYKEAGDSGFIHAPSLTHATAAALLRNAHLGASGAPAADSPFAIRLSSRRIRDAEAILSGIRQGQPLGALLGYRVERALHELGLDLYIPVLRGVAPLTPSRIDPSDQPLEAIAANNVVDGLLLNDKWLHQKADVSARITAAGPDLTKVGRELDQLNDVLDGLADGLVAEAAYQMARGNPTRLAASLAAISQGDAAPPELEVAHIPRSGIALTHRVLLLTPPTDGPGPGWASSARTAAEPALDAWAGRLMGDPRQVRCTVETLDSTKVLTLSDLDLGALDAVYGVDPSASAEAVSELEQRVLYAAKGDRLNHDRPADLAAGELTLLDLIEQARGARRLIESARAAEPGDFAALEREDPGTLGLAELEARAAKAEAGLQAAVNAASVTDADALRAALLGLGGYGLSPAVPVMASEALSAQAAGLIKTAQARLDKGANLRALPAAADPRARAQQLCDRLTAVFGPGFLVLPRFTCGADTASLFTAARAGAAGALDNQLAPVEGWMVRAARVRDPLSRLTDALRTAEALGSSEHLDLRLAQLPFDPADRWVGLAPEAGKPLAAGKLSLVVQTTGADPDLTKPLAGLWVDEWVEVAPATEETTAVTFAYDPPDVMAPQAVLLAVPPVLGQDWTVGGLHKVLLEALNLAKLRGVDPEALSDAADYLPATYLAFNVENDAVSSDLGPLT